MCLCIFSMFFPIVQVGAHIHVRTCVLFCLCDLQCCRIAKGQRCAKKLTDLQLRNMIKYTAKPAHKRRQDIMEKVRHIRVYCI